VKPYERIAPNDSENRVVSLLGKPRKITTDRETIKTSVHTPDEFAEKGREVTKTFWYEVPDFTGTEFLVGFDSEGRAVSKGQLMSP
jgi:hypothetical protein